MVVKSGNDEFHGVDAYGDGMNGHHAIGIDANVRGCDLEHFEPRTDDRVGICVSRVRHVASGSFKRRLLLRPWRRLDGPARRDEGFLYHRRRDKCCTKSNSGRRLTLAANHPPY